MSLRDFRKLIDVGPPGADYIGVIVEDPNLARPIRLELAADGYELHVQLDEPEAGELFDALAQALREVVGGRATTKLHPDTPAGSGPLSDESGSIQPRG